MKNHVIKAIRERRSVRKFTDQKIPLPVIRKIIEAGTWAPSGMNNQPWRFAVVADADVKRKMAALTHCSSIIQKAAVLIAVFLDRRSSYDRRKDSQAIGACIQNILLAAHGMGIGTCWIGEILKNKHRVRRICGLKGSLELQAVIALGYPAEKPRSRRKPLDSFIPKSIM